MALSFRMISWLRYTLKRDHERHLKKEERRKKKSPLRGDISIVEKDSSEADPTVDFGFASNQLRSMICRRISRDGLVLTTTMSILRGDLLSQLERYCEILRSARMKN